MKINIFGTVFGITGYDRHTRGLVNALYKLTPNIHLETPRPLDWIRYSNDEEVKMIDKNLFYKDGVSIFIGLPSTNKLVLSEKSKYFVQFVVWEGDKIPSSWLPHLLDERIDQIWVPSEHTKQAIINSWNEKNKDVKKFMDNEYCKLSTAWFHKIKIVPHGIDAKIFYPEETHHKDKSKFTFVCNKGWSRGMNDRGGVQFLIKAYTEEFTKQDNVRMFVKVNPAYNSPEWNFLNELQKLGIDTKNPNLPILEFNPNPLFDHQLNQLYNMADVFIATPMAEAFGLPFLEAMACGIPVISTSYGGQIDFINNENGWLINEGEMVNVVDDVMYEGIKWNQPKIEDIRKVMRYVYEHREEIKDKKMNALNTARQMTWDNSAMIAMTYLMELK